MTVCFCTLAIHEPYRRRARLLCADAPEVPWVVLTDKPRDFMGLGVRAIRHSPTGPMAVDYLSRLPPTGSGRGDAAYHDKRFAILAALEDHDTAIFVDADSRIESLPTPGNFPNGLAALPVIRESVEQHLEKWGAWRQPVFAELAQFLNDDSNALREAHWCHESVLAVTKDGRESSFFQAWALAADFLQSRGVYSGEGGVIGLAALRAGWDVEYEALTEVGAAVRHEGGGPKREERPSGLTRLSSAIVGLTRAWRRAGDR
jgi:hypothetical protein